MLLWTHPGSAGIAMDGNRQLVGSIALSTAIEVTRSDPAQPCLLRSHSPMPDLLYDKSSARRLAFRHHFPLNPSTARDSGAPAFAFAKRDAERAQRPTAPFGALAR